MTHSLGEEAIVVIDLAPVGYEVYNEFLEFLKNYEFNNLGHGKYNNLANRIYTNLVSYILTTEISDFSIGVDSIIHNIIAEVLLNNYNETIYPELNIEDLWEIVFDMGISMFRYFVTNNIYSKYEVVFVSSVHLDRVVAHVYYL